MKKQGELIKKQFPLTTLAVDNRTSVIILTIIIVLFGIWSYITMPKESYPEVIIPQVYIGTAYPGNSPVDMENLVTRPIEKELKSLTGVKKVTSTSVQNYSTIVVEFDTGVDIGKALQDVKDKVDNAKPDLPTNDPNFKEPNVIEVNLSELPIMFVNISGKYSQDELKVHAEYLQDEIEKLTEISEVSISGIKDREVRIDADLYKMEAMKVSFQDVERAISSENVTISGGNIPEGDFRRSIRVKGEFENVDEIKDVIVKSEDGNTVYLRDIANVKYTYEEAESYARSSTLPVVSLGVKKRSGQNILIATKKINKIIEEAKKTRFPKDLQITVTNDQSSQIQAMVSNLENSIISGVILVILVLLFFMGLRSAVFVGIAIPLSMFISFIILSAFGVTLNMMVLFSLILALGMLVDNGIVVIENIYRLLEEGRPLKEAIKEGVGEIALPIIASTATTVAAFLPLAFWPGMMGDFMKYLPITLIIVLSASLFVGLVINPAIAMMFAKLEKEKKGISKKTLIIGGALILFSLPFYIGGGYFFANLLMISGTFTLLNIYVLEPASSWFQNKGLVILENLYSKVIYFALYGWRPYIFFAGTIILLIFSIFLVGSSGLKVLFFPENEPDYVNIFIERPIGTDIEVTNDFAKEVEAKVLKLMKPYNYMVEAVIAQVGAGTSDPQQGPSMANTPHKAKIAISFVDYPLRKGQSTSELLKMIREEMKNYAGANITVAKDANGPGTGAEINLEVRGEDYEKLIVLSERLKRYLEDAAIPGVEGLQSDLEQGNPEVLLNVDREKAQRVGLSSAAIATELRTALFGKEISKFKDGEDDYPIQLRLEDSQRYNIETLKNKVITFNQRGRYKQIPISAVADLEYTSSFGSVKRRDMNKLISIYSNVKEGYNANEIVGQMKKLIDVYDVPDGFTVLFTGAQEQQDESSAFLLKAFALALFMVFLIIVTQFNSISAPLVIMCSVLFSTIGVFLGLVIFKMDFVILMTGIGIISLAGVVVNNAIVLIDYTNLLRKRRKADLGIPEEAGLPTEEFLLCIAEAGKTRLRPVLLTAITTVLGLLPLATGLSIDFYGLLARFDPNIYFGDSDMAFFVPMAWTVIFGLTFATFLTLVIVPIMYLLTDKLKFKKKVEKKEMQVSF